MSGLSPQDARRVVQAIRAGEVPDALAVLERSPKLLVRDLPPIRKQDLAEIASAPASLRQLLLGICSPFTPVRRFSQRLLRNLGSAAAEQLLLLGLDAADANRLLAAGETGSLGNYDGHPSPIGARLDAASSWHAATAYAAACARAIAQALAALDPGLVAALREYLEIVSAAATSGARPRPWATAEGAVDMLPLMLSAVSRAFDHKVARGDPGACTAVLAWAERHLLVGDEGEPKGALQEVCRRSRALGDPACDTAVRLLRCVAATSLGVIEPSSRRCLYQTLVRTSLENPGSLSEETAIVARMQQYAGRFQKDGPHLELPVLEARLQLARLEARLAIFGEEQDGGDDAAPQPESRGWSMRAHRKNALERQARSLESEDRLHLLELDAEAARAALAREEAKAKSRGEELARAQAPPRQAQPPPPRPTSRLCPRGPSVELVTRALLVLAKELGYPRLWWAVVAARHLRGSCDESDAPRQCSGEHSARLELSLQALLELSLDTDAKKTRGQPPLPAEELLDKRAYAGPHLAEAELTGAAWGPNLLAEILERAESLRESFPVPPADGETESPSEEQTRLSAMLLAGITVLPGEEIEELADWCRRHVDPRRVFHSRDHLEPALDLFRQRRIIAAEMLHFLIAHVPRLRFDLGVQRAIAALYHHGVRGREVVLEVIRTMPLPSPGETGSGTAWKQPWQKMLWDAWSGGDLELLIAALERCAVQTVGAPDELRLPRLPRASEFPPQADVVPEEGGVPLARLWDRLRADAPECLSGILASMVACAGADPLPVELLLVACREEQLLEDGTRLPVAGVLGLLESPVLPVRTAGLEITLRCPAFLSGHLEQAVGALERLLARGTGPCAQDAACALAAIAARHPRQRPAILQILMATESPARYARLVDELLAMAGEEGAPS